MPKAPLPFLALAIAFVAFGVSSGQYTFIYVGVVFLAVAVMFFLKSRRR